MKNSRVHENIKVGGININYSRYADDISMQAETPLNGHFDQVFWYGFRGLGCTCTLYRCVARNSPKEAPDQRVHHRLYLACS